MCVYIHTYIYIHIYIYIHTLAYIYNCMLSPLLQSALADSAHAAAALKFNSPALLVCEFVIETWRTVSNHSQLQALETQKTAEEKPTKRWFHPQEASPGMGKLRIMIG